MQPEDVQRNTPKKRVESFKKYVLEFLFSISLQLTAFIICLLTNFLRIHLLPS